VNDETARARRLRTAPKPSQNESTVVKPYRITKQSSEVSHALHFYKALGSRPLFEWRQLFSWLFAVFICFYAFYKYICYICIYINILCRLVAVSGWRWGFLLRWCLKLVLGILAEAVLEIGCWGFLLGVVLAVERPKATRIKIPN